MKNLVLLFSLFSSLAFSQYYATYKLIESPEKDFNIIAIWEKPNKDYTLRIEVPSKESYEKVFIDLNKKELSKFKSLMDLSFTKYKEWKKVAEENNVEKITKKINNEMVFLPASFISSLDNNLQFAKLAIADFYFAKEKEISLLIVQNPTELKSNNYNSYRTSKGYTLIFTSEKEIEDFISLLDEQKIIDFLNGKTRESELFK